MEENKEKVSLVENILNEEEDNINISEEVITTISGIAVSVLIRLEVLVLFLL